MGEPVRVERRGEVDVVVLDRADAANALTSSMIASLSDALDAAARGERARAVLITAQGRHFCAGADLAEANREAGVRPRPGDLHRRMAAGSNRLLRMMHELELPIVGAVRGVAAGLGCMVALSCDYVVVTPGSRLSTPFVRHGFSPDSGATFLLPRLVGMARAKEMLLLGREVDGQTAAGWGLVNEVAPEEALEERAAAVAEEMAGSATVAMGLARTLMHRAMRSDLPGAMAEEGLAVELAVRTRDFKEGMEAFAQRRPPRYEGR